MSHKLHHNTQWVGTPPGTLIYIGDKPVGNVRISIHTYNQDRFQVTEVTHLEQCFPNHEKGLVKWVDMDGIQKVEVVKEVGNAYGLHNLVLEDILNSQLRPKIEFFDNYVFVLCKMLSYDDKKGEVLIEQVSFVLGDHYVLSLQEVPGDVFDPIRERIKSNGSRIRRGGADFLLYSLLDVIIDNYFLVLEKIGEKLEGLEEEISQSPSRQNLAILYKLKRELIFVRKAVWPMREIINTLYQDEGPLIEQDTRKYLRDAYDHTIQVIDTLESYRDIAAGLLDVYLSGLSNKTNDTMKVLTIISTIFMPLTFIAGVYGMNFDNMPELHLRYGYFWTLGVMFVCCLCMIAWFRRKNWL
ncbi:magnesium/cobalt transporter CorA [Cytophagaceae bacterium DM2B3-1]|uniref:Magnesium transport protein CorA n=1 Tax=Xanthocytophaga flava TaxID=3048013 RepID=A0ABT7CHJ4_9BACT|nr:magnesium/cobalt transporter CorA [Xanthocytophaga flavus]MDJ1468325.1 magnesium/cobalt transporter CorA [Xanthocytophaga flavus]MDJ1493211.1 magnesium/cobalt transporter CorA [Xanthocytophaga flavus]